MFPRNREIYGRGGGGNEREVGKVNLIAVILLKQEPDSSEVCLPSH